MAKETSPEEYWKSVEAEIGESVRSYALAQVLMPAQEKPSGLFRPKPQWGLVYITETALFVERGTSPNWLQRIMTTRAPADAEKKDRIPLADISRVTIPPPLSPIRQFFAGPEIQITVEYAGAPNPMTLILDRRGPRDKVLMELLTAAVG